MSWNPFRKRKIDSFRNIVDELANSLQHEGKIDNLENELVKLNLDELNDREKESWHHLYGICAFQAGNHLEASERFRNGLMTCPDSSQIKFSLAQEYIFLNQSKKAFPLFDECIFPTISREFTLAMSRYAYLFSEHEKGINYLEKILDLYKEVKILDDHFLYVRGLPFFGVTWSYLAAHSVLSGNEEKLLRITEDIEKVCYDYDFDVINGMYECLVSGNSSKLLSSLYKQRKESGKYNLPTGYTDLRIAIFESFSRGTLQETLIELDAVKLTINDFPWLEDIRLLAKANTANRFEEIQMENQFLDHFLTNQPLLFEPDHAVSFGLLEYQEKIKLRVSIVGS